MFENKVALITGVSQGIGNATARNLYEKGADVILVDIDEKGLNDLESQLLAENKGRVKGFVCDVRDEQKVYEIVENCLKEFGKIDILVNNAAIYLENYMEFIKTKSDFWRRKIDVNIYGTLYFTHAVLNSMIENNYGRIINIASVAGKYGIRYMADYSLTKGAIIAFSKALAREVAPNNVLVNTVSPGNINPNTDHAPDLSYMNRSGTPEECANLICFLASNEASYISGEDYVADGCRKKI